MTTQFTSTIKRYKGQYVFIIPDEIVRDLNIKIGEEVELKLQGSKIIILFKRK